MTEEEIKKEKKALGPSKYSNSKKKKKKKTVKKDPKITKKNHDLKVKIKNLEKEINRIESIDANSSEIKKLQEKIVKLTKIHDDLAKSA